MPKQGVVAVSQGGEDLLVVGKDAPQLLQARLVAGQFAEQFVARRAQDLVLQFLQPRLQRKQDAEIAIDHDPAKPQGQHGGSGGETTGVLLCLAPEFVGAGGIRRMARDQKAPADEKRQLDGGEVGVLRFRGQSPQQQERVIPEMLELGRMPLAQRIRDGKRMQAEVLTQQPARLPGRLIAQVEPYQRALIGFPALDKLPAPDNHRVIGCFIQHAAYHSPALRFWPAARCPIRAQHACLR